MLRLQPGKVPYVSNSVRKLPRKLLELLGARCEPMPVLCVGFERPAEGLHFLIPFCKPLSIYECIADTICERDGTCQRTRRFILGKRGGNTEPIPEHFSWEPRGNGCTG